MVIKTLLGLFGCCIHLADFKVNAFAKYSEPQSRPTFQELVERLRDLQRQYAIQLQATRAASGDGSQKEP